MKKAAETGDRDIIDVLYSKNADANIGGKNIIDVML